MMTTQVMNRTLGMNPRTRFVDNAPYVSAMLRPVRKLWVSYIRADVGVPLSPVAFPPIVCHHLLCMFYHVRLFTVCIHSIICTFSCCNIALHYTTTQSRALFPRFNGADRCCLFEDARLTRERDLRTTTEKAHVPLLPRCKQCPQTMHSSSLL
jgi:hypothetical protein